MIIVTLCNQILTWYYHSQQSNLVITLQISYREKLAEPISYTDRLENVIGKQRNIVSMSVVLTPASGQPERVHATFSGVEIPASFHNPNDIYVKAVNKGIQAAFMSGEL